MNTDIKKLIEQTVDDTLSTLETYTIIDSKGNKIEITSLKGEFKEKILLEALKKFTQQGYKVDRFI